MNPLPIPSQIPEVAYQFILYLAGAIIMLLLGAIAFFLQKWIGSTDKLTESVNNLGSTVSLMKTNQDNFADKCGFHHKTIDGVLREHRKAIDANTEKLNEHGEAIAELKSETRNPKRATRN